MTRPQDQPSARISAAATRIRVDAATAEVARAFEAAGIGYLLLKGPSIARWLYDEPRFYGDTDLFVDPRRIADAERVLDELGYRPQFETFDFVRPPHGDEWMRPVDGMRVDLHREIVGMGLPGPRQWELLTERAVPLRVASVDVPVLDPSSRLVHLVLHAAHHGPSADQPLADLRQALGRIEIEGWRDALEVARELEATAAFIAGLELVPEGADLLGALGSPAARSAEATLRASGEVGTSLFWEWLGRQSPLRRLTLLLRKTVPPPRFMREWSPLARRGPMGLAAAYLWRPLWMLKVGLPGLVRYVRARRGAGRG